MTEVKALIDSRVIEMLKDFMDPNTNTGIDTVHLEWGDELYSLLTTLGRIITQTENLPVQQAIRQELRKDLRETLEAKGYTFLTPKRES